MDKTILAAVFLTETERQLKAKTGWFTAGDLANAVVIFLEKIDEAIRLAEENLTGGATKKQFVLEVVGKLYDMVIVKALPTWAYWLNPYIKDVVINILVSKFIDYVVSKYNAGNWNLK